MIKRQEKVKPKPIVLGFIRKNTLERSRETHIHYCCHENNFAYVNVQRNETESPICMP